MAKANTPDRLRDFISHARDKDMDHQTIRMLLLSAGWKERDIAQAIGAEGLEKPVPVPPDSGGARDAFFHLLAFAGLYTAIISSLILVFTYINLWFPDAQLERYISMDYVRSSVRWSLAALLVASPIYFWMSRILLKEMSINEDKEHSGVRRWLTYLTLFVAAGALMGDLTTLIFRLLEGEVTLRFLLKVLAVFTASGMVFGYYSTVMRRPLDEQGNLHRIFAAVAGSLLGLVILYGFVVAGSPGSERDRKTDELRVDDIRTIADAILDYAYDGRRYQATTPDEILDVPTSLSAFVKENPRYSISLTDPTGEAYRYEALGSDVFNVCSTFDTQSESLQWQAPFWEHPAGAYCYTFDTSRPDLP
jgi:hypothetical protein